MLLFYILILLLRTVIYYNFFFLNSDTKINKILEKKNFKNLTIEKFYVYFNL